MVEKYPEEATMLIFGDGLDKHAIQRCKDIGVNIVAAMVDRTTRQNVRLAHKEGITVNLWPGHNTDDFVTSWMLGADIVCTDVPGTLMKWLDESGWKKRAKL
jgi:glycerophosphoryl diester phosphodiesterase